MFLFRVVIMLPQLHHPACYSLEFHWNKCNVCNVWTIVYGTKHVCIAHHQRHWHVAGKHKGTVVMWIIQLKLVVWLAFFASLLYIDELTVFKALMVWVYLSDSKWFGYVRIMYMLPHFIYVNHQCYLIWHDFFLHVLQNLSYNMACNSFNKW